MAASASLQTVPDPGGERTRDTDPRATGTRPVQVRRGSPEMLSSCQVGEELVRRGARRCLGRGYRRFGYFKFGRFGLGRLEASVLRSCLSAWPAGS